MALNDAFVSITYDEALELFSELSITAVQENVKRDDE